jgi:uncharacterized protein (DUF433 family)
VTPCNGQLGIQDKQIHQRIREVTKMSSHRITTDPHVMFGQPCIRGLPVTVTAVVGMISSGESVDEILSEYPFLESEDISAALDYAAATSNGADHPVAMRKPRPNHQRTLRILRAMSPQQKLAQVFKLNERTLKLFRIGLRRRFPDLDETEFEKVYLQMRARCHNRNY